MNKNRQQTRRREIGFMVFLTLCCLGLSFFRYAYSDTKTFLFLNWNLFLAFIPWLLTTLVLLKPKLQKNILLLLLLMGVWLLFFPNAPYILTDLFHLRARTSMPIWFDLVLILSYAWTGLMFGYMSLWDMEQMMSRFIRPRHIPFISVPLLFLGSFGIYLGRYLRWNSWDIIQKPFALFYDISDRITDPFSYPRAWGMTLCLGLFLTMIYYSFRLIRNRE